MNAPRRPAASHGLLLIIAYVGFVSLGLPDTLVGVAWPSVRETFGLSQSALALIFFGAGSSYVLSGVLSGRAVQSVGVGFLLAASSGLVALSALGYAVAPVWALFAACSLLHGLGSGAIDSGLNYYAAHHFSARHMNWLHASWSLGATLGPIIMTAAVARNQWRLGYGSVAAILILLALVFLLTRRRWEAPPTEEEAEAAVGGEPGIATPGDGGLRAVLRHPLVRFQAALFFVYSGLEVTLGQWSFTVLTESRGFPEASAGAWVTTYWASIGVGRVLLGTVADRIGIDRLVRFSMLTALAGVVLYAADLSPAVTALALGLAGLGLATIYPSMMTRTPQRLGRILAAHAIGFQVSAAVLGGAAIPSLAGLFADRFGLEALPIATVILAVALFALHERLTSRQD